jgi:hypothetical protein|tara:strand:- start:27717 stop:28055 length:339 start_codon:yes stop_codon:yes gene_type:complete
MGKKSREKGKRGELEAARFLREHGFEARRGRQFQGGQDSPDVVHSVPGLHLEVKRVESLSLYPAMEQAREDAVEDDVPAVLHRRNRQGWLIIMDADDFFTRYCPEPVSRDTR